MKPSFALNLSHDGIGLLHRTPAGWFSVAEVALDTPDLAVALAHLRRTALGLSPQGLTSKLVIPASQILYLELDAPGPDAARRRSQIAAALEGRTPYRVEDLVYDWSGTGTQVQVAVVARETLAEAEGFAEQYGFSPVSFVAIPGSGEFAGEPFFGLSSTAAQHLPEGARLDRDQDPIRVVGAHRVAAQAGPAESSPATDTPPADAAVATVAADAVAPASVTDARLEDLREAAREALAEEGLADLLAEDPEGDERVELPDTARDELAAAGFAALAAASAAEPAERHEVPGDLSDDAREELAEAGFTDQPPAAAPETHPNHGVAQAVAPDLTVTDVAASTVSDLPDAEAAPVKAEPARVAHDAQDPAEPSLEAPVAAPNRALNGVARDLETGFVSRRRVAAPDPGAGRAGAPRLGAAAIPDTPPPAPEGKPLAARPLPSVLAPGLVLPEPPEPDPQPKDARRAKGGKDAAGSLSSGGLRAAAKSTAALGGTAGKALARGLIARVNIPGGHSGKMARAPAPVEAATGKTVFGGTRAAPSRGRPKYLGLTLTAILILFMVIVALWSSLLGNRAPQPAGGATATLTTGASAPDVATVAQGSSPTETAASPAPEADADPALAIAEPEPAPAEMTEPLVATETGSAAEVTAPSEPGAAPTITSAPAAAPSIAPAQVPMPAAAGTAVWGEIAPDATAGLSLQAVSTADPVPAAAPRAGLPAADSLTVDVRPQEPLPPAPFDQLARMDADGSLQPTASGVVAPGGFTLFAGAPPVLPKPRPAAVSAAAERAAADPADPAAAPVPPVADPAFTEPEPYADPALAGFRPQTRPAGLTPPPAAPTDQPAETAPASPPGANDGAGLTAAPEVQIAAAGAAKPRPRPGTVAAAAGAAAAEAEARAAAEAAAAATIASATPQAVTLSRRPASKPRNFSGAVEAALALAVTAAPAPAPAAAPAPVAAAAPAPRAAAKPSPAPAPSVVSRPEEEEDEPEPTSAAPKLPTSASVAKQATQANVLSLGKINLIGLYGASGNRRALVRLSSGKFVKVEVGDRLDGGRVTGIGDGQLTYQKNGKNLVLKLLQGG